MLPSGAPTGPSVRRNPLLTSCIVVPDAMTPGMAGATISVGAWGRGAFCAALAPERTNTDEATRTGRRSGVFMINRRPILPLSEEGNNHWRLNELRRFLTDGGQVPGKEYTPRHWAGPLRGAALTTTDRHVAMRRGILGSRESKITEETMSHRRTFIRTMAGATAGMFAIGRGVLDASA